MKKKDVPDFGPPANPIQKKIIAEFVRQEVNDQVAYLSTRYGLVDFSPHVTVNQKRNARFSYGGVLVDDTPYVVISVSPINMRVGDLGTYHYEEYPFLKNKGGIGSAWANWKKWTAWLIAHELAHAVVETDKSRAAAEQHITPNITRDRRDHGMFWQFVYRDLRCGYCNTKDYVVEPIDFSDFVFHVSERCRDTQRLTFYKDQEPIAYYVRARGHIFESNATFKKRRRTPHKNVGEIRKSLVTA